MQEQKKKGDPLFEVWCETCLKKVRDYRMVGIEFKCECCITAEEAASLQATLSADPATLTDDEWELPPGALYRPPGGGENAA